MSFAFRLLHSQLCVTVPVPTTSFAGRTVLVTGGNTGLGLEAAQHFVRLGASRVILTTRTLSKGLSAKTTIEDKTGCAPEIVQVWELSLSSYASVIAFAEKADRELDRLDVVVENAGVHAGSYRVVEDDEETITVNVVSTFLLMLLLLPKLRDTKAKFGGDPVVSVVNSDGHFLARFPELKAENVLATLNNKNARTMMERYNISKLLGLLIVRHLAPMLESSGVVLNAISPGFCYSNLGREIQSVTFRVGERLLARTAEEGGRMLVIGAGWGRESHGKYLGDGGLKSVSSFAASKEGAEVGNRVWKELAEKLEKIQPGVLGKLEV